MLLSVVAPAQDVPIFQVDKCSRESSMFNGDVAEVTGRAVNPGKAHWQSARFKALVRMVSKEDPAKVVEKTGSAEVFKFVLKKRTLDSRLGRIENITIDGAQGIARGTTLMSGHADRPLRNVGSARDSCDGDRASAGAGVA